MVLQQCNNEEIFFRAPYRHFVTIDCFLSLNMDQQRIPYILSSTCKNLVNVSVGIILNRMLIRS